MQWHWVTYSCFDEALFLLFQYKYWIVKHNSWNIIWPCPLSPFFGTNAFISSCSFGRLWSSAFSKIALNSICAIDRYVPIQYCNWGWAATSNESRSICIQGDSASPRGYFSFAPDTCFYAPVWWKSLVSVVPIWVIQVYAMGVDHFHRLTSSHFNRRHIVDFRAAGWKTTKACFVHASPLELDTWIDMFYFTWSRRMHQDKKFPRVKLFWLHVTLGIQDFKICPLGDFETEHFVSGTGDENPSWEWSKLLKIKFPQNDLYWVLQRFWCRPRIPSRPGGFFFSMHLPGPSDCNETLSFFLSDPGPIIVYPCH